MPVVSSVWDVWLRRGELFVLSACLLWQAWPCPFVLSGVLKDQVCSPGGTTIAGVHALEKVCACALVAIGSSALSLSRVRVVTLNPLWQGGFRAAVMDAVYTAANRAKELGAK